MTPRRPPSTPTLTATRVLLLLGGGLLTLLMVGVTAFSVAGALVQTTERGDVTLTGSFDRVVVRVSGTADIRPGPTGRARVVRRSDFAFQRPRVEQRIVDGVLQVSVRCRGASVVCDNHVELTVPRAVELDVQAEHVAVSDTTGPIRISSGGGTVELERVAGAVDARVGGGAIFGRDLRSTDVRADTGGGSIELDFATAPEWVVASAGAGHVGITLPVGEEAYRVQADVGVGDPEVTVRQDAQSERVIRATAGAGAVTVRYRAA